MVIVHTSKGDAPANAVKFESLLNKYSQRQNIQFSVVGFGSKKYKKFCGFAEKVDALLESQPKFYRFVDIFMINNRSVEEFGKWEKSWSEKTGITI